MARASSKSHATRARNDSAAQEPAGRFSSASPPGDSNKAPSTEPCYLTCGHPQRVTGTVTASLLRLHLVEDRDAETMELSIRALRHYLVDNTSLRVVVNPAGQNLSEL